MKRETFGVDLTSRRLGFFLKIYLALLFEKLTANIIAIIMY